VKVSFSEAAFKEYLDWQGQDKKTLVKINVLIQDIQRNGALTGIGKPEALRGRKAFSRRIDEANRLVYVMDAEQNMEILSCKGHYEA
jgi:toxin YoeB